MSIHDSTHDRDRLTEKDHHDLDTLICGLLNDYKDGLSDLEACRDTFAHLITALDQRNYTEVQTYLRQGRKTTRNQKK